MKEISSFIPGVVLVTLPALIIAFSIHKARRTTLIAPLAWALLAYLVLILSAICFHLAPSLDGAKWTYIASTATLCPTVALFGAKRPQNRAWQMIVLAFWFVLALPAIQSLMMHRGEAFDLHSLWRWLLVFLIVAGGVNYLPTRFFWASWLLILGEGVLFGNYLPWPTFLSTVGHLEAGIYIIITGIGIAFFSSRRTQQRLGSFRGWNRAWLDFRDYFGVVWALRVMERVNSLPARAETHLRLTWDGFYYLPPLGHDNCNPSEGGDSTSADHFPPVPEALDLPLASPIEIAPLDAPLRNLLRRFVSNQWLESRLESDQNRVKVE